MAVKKYNNTNMYVQIEDVTQAKLSREIWEYELANDSGLISKKLCPSTLLHYE